MAKKQTRRSVSLNRATYERLRAYCETNGIPMSQFVEKRIGEVLGFGDRPDQGANKQSTPVPAENAEKNRESHIFTF